MKGSKIPLSFLLKINLWFSSWLLNVVRGGFEPPLRKRKNAFQARAFKRFATSPKFK